MQKKIISFFVLLLWICSPYSVWAQSKRAISHHWHVREFNKSTWIPAEVPGTIHTDLMRAGIIPDPFYGTNEKEVQWVGERSWVYETTFQLSETEYTNPQLALVFEGLDTYARLYLNDSLLVEADNMFRIYRLPIAGIARSNNRLRVVFDPAEARANQLARKAKPLVRPCENNRHYVRKAQFHFGWDWAPHLVTCGIWKPVYLTFDAPTTPPPSVLPPVKWHNEKDSIGQAFYFTLNGKPIYMRGANWVPADVFLPRVDKAKYRQLLVQAKQMGMNMLRVWGGGIYESDDFYTLCDSLGIWIWQDFMFAGAMYPASDSAFKTSVLAEVRDNVLRLRKHPCIVLWCGNNEIDEAWHNWGWQKQHQLNHADSALLWKEYCDLFQVAIPDLIKQLDPGRPYIASSPLYGWGRKQSMTMGDSHYWGVWWGAEPKEKYQEKVPRFMSEFGMQAMPNSETLHQFGVANTFSLSDKGLRAHQKHPTGFETISIYLKQNRYPQTYSDWGAYITATQAMQSDLLMTAIKAQEASNGRCMGSLIWQLNDCWPVCSWSLIDYYGRPKAAVNRLKEIWTSPYRQRAKVSK